MMKYIIFKAEDTGELIPIIFPTIINHKKISEKVKGLLSEALLERVLPVSAGYTKITCQETFENSISLNLKSREEDVEIINKNR